MRFSLRTLCGVAVAGAVAAGPAATAKLAHPLDDAAAESMAAECFAHSHANSWPPFSIAIVDAGGAVILLRRQDGASSVTAEAALLKARTASRSGASTGDLIGMSQDPPTRDLMLQLQLTDDPGGVPLKAGRQVIGAVGVSGGTAAQDMGCASLAAGVLTAEKK
jgi:uncharacterized protein GlcG (DUF336 family)